MSVDADRLTVEIIGRHWPYAGGTSCEGCLWRAAQGDNYATHLVEALHDAGITLSLTLADTSAEVLT